MPEGWIYYVGRARRGWGTRCRRYARGIETPHWHVDYLMSCSDATLRGICPVRWRPEEECQLFRALEGLAGISPLSPGFGASDCSTGCTAHAASGGRPPSDVFRLLSERCAGIAGWIKQDQNGSRWQPLDGGKKRRE